MLFKLAALGVPLVSLVVPGLAQVNVLTANYGNERSNWNGSETALTTSNVSTASFGRIGAFPVDGQIYAQPLYVSGVTIPGQGVHNVLYTVTQHNTVFAYDADQVTPPQLLWSVNLGPSIPSSTFGSTYTDITPEIGILSTPVIDPARGVIYVVSGSPSGSSVSYSLHALDLTTGKEMLNGPALIRGSLKGTGVESSNGLLSFDPLYHIQRPGLLLADGSVWVGFGSHADTSPWHGWLMKYNAADLSKAPAVISTSPNGWGGSIWASGFGLAADTNGSIYAISGNGTYDGATEFGESFLRYTAATTKLADWFTPPNWQLMEDQDYDLSAGPALIPGTHTLIGGDKYGLLYVVNGDSMGHLDTGHSAAQVNQVVSYGEVFNFAILGSGQSATIYLQQKAGNLMAFPYTSKGLATTAAAASSTTSDSAYVGLAVSSNGTQNGTAIVWETTNNKSIAGTPGTLHAFDAGNVANELWNSDMASGDALGDFAKFANPTVVNGKVYVPTWSNALVVYSAKQSGTQLPRPVITGIGNASNYGTGGVAPGEMVTIFGTNLGPANLSGSVVDASNRVTKLNANTVVLFDGVPAPIVYTSAGQVSAIVPYGVNATATAVQVAYQGVVSAAVSVPVAASEPGIFSLDSSGTGQAVVVNQDGTLNSTANPAPAGSVIFFYATGTGALDTLPMDGSIITGTPLPTSAAPVTAQLGGENASVTYAGSAPNFVAGLMQVNVTVPADMAPGQQPLQISVNGASSQGGIWVAVK